MGNFQHLLTKFHFGRLIQTCQYQFLMYKKLYDFEQKIKLNQKTI